MDYIYFFKINMNFANFCKNLLDLILDFAKIVSLPHQNKEMLKMARKINKIRKQDEEKKTIRKNFRCTESRAKQINDSDYTIDEMLDFFFLFSEDEHFEKLMRLRELRFELKFKKQALDKAKQDVNELEDNVLSIEIEIEQLQELLKDANYNLNDYAKAKRIHNSIQTTLEYYREHYNPTNNPLLSIDEFLASKKTRTYVKQQATRCGVGFDEYAEMLVKAYNESEVQQVLV